MREAGCERIRLSGSLLGFQAVEVELAASKVEDVAVSGEAEAQFAREVVDALLSLFSDGEQPGLLEDAQVFRCVVGRCGQGITEFRDGAWTGDEFANEFDARGFGECAHGIETVEGKLIRLRHCWQFCWGIRAVKG